MSSDYLPSNVFLFFPGIFTVYVCFGLYFAFCLFALACLVVAFIIACKFTVFDVGWYWLAVYVYIVFVKLIVKGNATLTTHWVKESCDRNAWFVWHATLTTHWVKESCDWNAWFVWQVCEVPGRTHHLPDHGSQRVFSHALCGEYMGSCSRKCLVLKAKSVHMLTQIQSHACVLCTCMYTHIHTWCTHMTHTHMTHTHMTHAWHITHTLTDTRTHAHTQTQHINCLNLLHISYRTS